MGSRLGVGWALPSNVINCCNFTGKLKLGEGRDAPGSKSVLQISVCIWCFALIFMRMNSFFFFFLPLGCLFVLSPRLVAWCVPTLTNYFICKSVCQKRDKFLKILLSQYNLSLQAKKPFTFRRPSSNWFVSPLRCWHANDPVDFISCVSSLFMNMLFPFLFLTLNWKLLWSEPPNSGFFKPSNNILINQPKGQITCGINWCEKLPRTDRSCVVVE